MPLIFALTAYNKDEFTNKGHFDYFLQKPINIDILS